MGERPTYETQNHLSEEKGVVKEIEKTWACQAVKLPKAYQLDYAIIRQKEVVAWLEIKCRNVLHGEYPTFMLSLNKWLAGERLARDTGKGFLLVVRYRDSLRYVNAKGISNPEIGFGGRVDRGDWQDQEPCVFIPTRFFTNI